MTEVGLGEKAPVTDIPFQTQLESLVRENPIFREIFVAGINQHIEQLRRSKKVDGQEEPDVKMAIDSFLELREVISTGFKGYEFRSFLGSPNSSSIVLNFARHEDLDPNDLSKLDLSRGKREEFEVIVGRLNDLSSFTNSPEIVVAERGIHMEASKRSLVYIPRAEKVLVKKMGGFWFNVTVDGACIGKAMKHDGILPYDSQRTYSVHLDSTSNLLREVARLGIN